jgi:polyphosphate kinase
VPGNARQTNPMSSNLEDFYIVCIDRLKRQIADYQKRHWSTASLNQELAELEQKLEAARATAAKEVRHETEV